MVNRATNANVFFVSQRLVTYIHKIVGEGVATGLQHPGEKIPVGCGGVTPAIDKIAQFAAIYVLHCLLWRGLTFLRRNVVRFCF